MDGIRPPIPCSRSFPVRRCRTDYVARLGTYPTMPVSSIQIPVSIIEDDEDFREGLRWMLSASPEFVCRDTYASVEAAVAVWEQTPPCPGEVILMDIGLPGISGVAGTRLIRERWPHVQVLMLTMHEEAETIHCAIQAGATGYVTKRTPPAALLEAIREVHRGGSPLSGTVARRVLETLRQHGAAPCDPFHLTDREREILQGLVDGHTYKAIAASLSISVDTVRSHIKKLYDKLGVHSRNEALAQALRMGLQPRNLTTPKAASDDS